MMDIVLGGVMGLVLAVLLSNPPREKARVVTSTVVDETKPDPKAASRGRKKK